MTGWNLPPGVSNADIERAFGGADPELGYSIEIESDSLKANDSTTPCDSLEDARLELARESRAWTRKGFTLVKLARSMAELHHAESGETITIKITEREHE
jgi:hypothetical protein